MEAATFSPPVGLSAARGRRLLRLRTDDQLVALFRFGNDEAFRVIHDRYRPRLLAYTRQMLSGSRADPEDALQDVFLRAYGALRTDDRPVTLRAWLYRVAHNRCVDQMRRPINQPTEELFENVRSLHDPAADVERREELARLVQDLGRLPEQQRSALLMRELEGLTYAELAGALDVSVPSIKSLLVRARIGLTESREARDAACGEIRSGITDAHDRGVRVSGRVRRHLRDCDGLHRVPDAAARGPEDDRRPRRQPERLGGRHQAARPRRGRRRGRRGGHDGRRRRGRRGVAGHGRWHEGRRPRLLRRGVQRRSGRRGHAGARRPRSRRRASGSGRVGCGSSGGDREPGPRSRARPGQVRPPDRHRRAARPTARLRGAARRRARGRATPVGDGARARRLDACAPEPRDPGRRTGRRSRPAGRDGGRDARPRPRSRARRSDPCAGRLRRRRTAGHRAPRGRAAGAGRIAGDPHAEPGAGRRGVPEAPTAPGRQRPSAGLTPARPSRGRRGRRIRRGRWHARWRGTPRPPG